MQSHQFKLGFIFGDAISSFAPKKKPSEADVIRFWMFEYDSRRGNKYRPAEGFHHEVIFVVVDSLMDFWKLHFPMEPVSVRWKVFEKVKDIVERVVPLMAFVRQRNSPEEHQEWIQGQLSRFESECDISVSTLDEKRLSKKAKRFDDEDLDYRPSSSKRAFVAELSESDSDDSYVSDDDQVSSNNKCIVYYKNTIAMIQRINSRGGNISLGIL